MADFGMKLGFEAYALLLSMWWDFTAAQLEKLEVLQRHQRQIPGVRYSGRLLNENLLQKC